MVVQVATREELDAQLNAAGNKLVVIDFYATWCGPCKKIAPELEALASSTPGMVLLKVDVDESEVLAGEYQITAMPTFILIKSKEQVEKFTGANFDRLSTLINKHI